MNNLSEENLEEYGTIKPSENNTFFMDIVQVGNVKDTFQFMVTFSKLRFDYD
jgi:hypothetical protein